MKDSELRAEVHRVLYQLLPGLLTELLESPRAWVTSGKHICVLERAYDLAINYFYEIPSDTA